jgi:hypothetical protein
MSKRPAIVALIVSVAAMMFMAQAALGSTGVNDKPKKPKKTDSPTPTPTPTPTPGCDDGSPGWDITDGGGDYTGPRLQFQVVSASPTCPEVTYVLHVLKGWDVATYATQAAGGAATMDTTEITSFSKVGDGSTELVYDEVVVETDPFVCVYSESIQEGTVLDRAPDIGCTTVSPTGSEGRSYN